MIMMQTFGRFLVVICLMSLATKTAAQQVQVQSNNGLLDVDDLGDMDIDLDSINITDALAKDVLGTFCSTVGSVTFPVDDGIDVTCSCSSAEATGGDTTTTTTTSSVVAVSRSSNNDDHASVSFSCSAEELCSGNNPPDVLLDFCVSFTYNGTVSVSSSDLAALVENVTKMEDDDNVATSDVDAMMTAYLPSNLPVKVTSNAKLFLSTWFIVPIQYPVDIVYQHSDTDPMVIEGCTAIVPPFGDCGCTPCDGLPIPSLDCIGVPCLI